MADNQIEEALTFAFERSVSAGEIPEWTPSVAVTQMRQFCDEIGVIENILNIAIDSGDVKMLARAAAQLQQATFSQLAGLSSVITLAAGKEVIEVGDTGKREPGKYEDLFKALIRLDLVRGDVDSGLEAARVTDLIQDWVSSQHTHFLYLMAASLQDFGWPEELVAEYTQIKVPEFKAGLLNNLDEELFSAFMQDSDDDTDSE